MNFIRRMSSFKSFKSPADKSGHGLDSAICTAVFGLPLQTLIRRDELNNRYETGDWNPHIPVAFQSLIRYFDNEEAISQPGIFRVSGNATHIRSCREKWDAVGEIDIADICEHSAVAALIKTFIREIPGSLISQKLAKSLYESRGNLDEFRSSLQKLPPENQALLDYLLCFLHRVASYEDHNKMGLGNIAIIFAPNCVEMTPAFPPTPTDRRGSMPFSPVTVDFATVMQENSQAGYIFEMLLRNYDKIQKKTTVAGRSLPNNLTNVGRNLNLAVQFKNDEILKSGVLISEFSSTSSSDSSIDTAPNSPTVRPYKAVVSSAVTTLVRELSFKAASPTLSRTNRDKYPEGEFENAVDELKHQTKTRAKSESTAVEPNEPKASTMRNGKLKIPTSRYQSRRPNLLTISFDVGAKEQDGSCALSGKDVRIGYDDIASNDSVSPAVSPLVLRSASPAASSHVSRFLMVDRSTLTKQEVSLLTRIGKEMHDRITATGGGSHEDRELYRKLKAYLKGGTCPQPIHRDGLREEKRRLQVLLHAYQEEFSRKNSRPVRTAEDREPAASEYRRYKILKAQMAASV